MKKTWVLSISLLMLLAVTSCGGQAEGQKNDQEGEHEMEIIPKVKEPSTEVVDTVGFPKEATGTPITGYQGYPDDDLVKESKDDDLVNFAGEADIDYYSGGGDDSGGY
ncbi:MAG: hypothetical protein IJV25_05550 [Prevotella sp.]|nr:hypothetical protein [Prevotella sp.]MBQ9649869.1 hypothetical protein [Prevotella sp.]